MILVPTVVVVDAVYEQKTYDPDVSVAGTLRKVRSVIIHWVVYEFASSFSRPFLLLSVKAKCSESNTPSPLSPIAEHYAPRYPRRMYHIPSRAVIIGTLLHELPMYD